MDERQDERPDIDAARFSEAVKRQARQEWIKSEITRHRMAIKALEMLREVPEVIEAAVEHLADEKRALAEFFSRVPPPEIVPETQSVEADPEANPWNAYSREEIDDDQGMFAEFLKSLIPIGQKTRISTLTDRARQSAPGWEPTKLKVERTLRGFPDRFREHERGWWSIIERKER